MSDMWASNLFHLASSACGTSTGWLPSLFDNIPCPGGEIKITGLDQVLVVIANAARIGMMVAGALAVIFLLVASIYYITSTGDAGRVKQAKDMILYTIIGLVVIVVAYGVITFVTSRI